MRLHHWVSGLCVAFVALSSTAAFADVISSGPFSVGINNPVGPAPGGNLYDPNTGIGFRRNGDGYDPISPGSPREAWGASANGISGYQDSFGSFSNLSENGAPTFGPSTGSVSSILGAGLLQIDQNYSFAAANVLAIGVTITNTTGVNQAVLFSRNVDWDIAPSAFSEVITADALGTFGGITIADASYWGFEGADPNDPFNLSSGAGGGTFGPSDLGAGILLNLGVLAPGQSISFDIIHAISTLGMTEAQLRAQLAALGVDFIISGRSQDGTNSAALGLRVQAVPEPASMLAWGLLTGVGLVGYRLRRRKLAA